MFTISRFEGALDTAVGALPGRADRIRLCVGLSGGLDSSVLLAAASEIGRAQPDRWSVRALHVDHALQPDSARWGRASRELAAAFSVDFEERRVDARGAPGQSPEAVARAARYAAFREALTVDEVLLTAHHADDQLETILLQWLRGGGLRAVAGMPPLAALGSHAWHARPLLGFARADLASWAHERQLTWIDDPSNQDRRFDRNYLRHEVLPALLRRWPSAARTAGRVGDFARDALALEAEIASQDLAAIRRGRTLELRALFELTEPRQRAALRVWLATLDLPVPTVEQLRALRHDIRAAAPDRIPQTTWPGAVVYRYRGRLHADTAAQAPFAQGEWHDPTATRFVLARESALELQPDVGKGLSRARLPARLLVRRRQGGEEFHPAGGAHRRPLRKWLQEHDVLPWRRQTLPLLHTLEAGLVAIADLACAHEFAAQPGEPSWRIVWHGRSIVTEPDAFGFRWPEHPTIG
jgi:tRNA(Ile)-lysidine synthase